MGAKKKPLDTLSVETPASSGQGGRRRLAGRLGNFARPLLRGAGQIIEDEDTNETLPRSIAGMARLKKLLAWRKNNILVYVLPPGLRVQQESLPGAVSEGAKLAASSCGEAPQRWSAETIYRRGFCATLVPTRTKVYRAKGAEGLAQPVVDVMAKVTPTTGRYAVFGGGLLGFEIGAGLAAR